MAEAISSTKGTAKKNIKDAQRSKSFLHIGSTPLNGPNRISLMSNAKLHKVTSSSFDKLSFISEKEDNNELENYNLEYSTYLLRKLQNKILSKTKEEKEENVKKCLVSIKWELESLLENYVRLSKEIGYYKLFFEVLTEMNEKIEMGKRVLKILKENDFDSLTKSLMSSLDFTVNQLQLVDIDKKMIDELFSKGIWGSGSEIEGCLEKINSFISDDTEEVSNVAAELVEIKELSLENESLKERFKLECEKILNGILNRNYKTFTNVVAQAFENKTETNTLDFDLEFLENDCFKSLDPQQSLQLSKLGNSYFNCPNTPNSASTPQ